MPCTGTRSTHHHNQRVGSIARHLIRRQDLQQQPLAVAASAASGATPPPSSTSKPPPSRETAYSVERLVLPPVPAGSSPTFIVEQLRTVGCALLPSVISRAAASHLAGRLRSYTIGLDEEMQRTDPLLRRLAAANQRGADVIDFGVKKEGVRSELLANVFNRDRDWLQLVDPSPVIEVADLALGDTCHLVTQKAWRNGPGHDSGGSLHVDELFVELPEELASDERYEPPIHIITALTYLVDVGPELCPTYVVPRSFRSGRRPKGGEMSWRGNTPMVVLAQAGDTLLFRSDVWHSGGVNRRADATRLLCETVYGQRKVAQKFWPYTMGFQLSPSTRAAATQRQMRLFGAHSISNYG
jgi:hypothetical protein